jgi:hypothetical protein
MTITITFSKLYRNIYLIKANGIGIGGIRYAGTRWTDKWAYWMDSAPWSQETKHLYDPKVKDLLQGLVDTLRAALAAQRDEVVNKIYTITI